jgi:hypothetical protein
MDPTICIPTPTRSLSAIHRGDSGHIIRLLGSAQEADPTPMTRLRIFALHSRSKLETQKIGGQYGVWIQGQIKEAKVGNYNHFET